MGKPKYYIYISDTKVEMLFAQIPKKLLYSLSSELEINLGFLKTKFSEGVPETSKYTKLQIVTEYLKKNNDIGTIGQPKSYFRGQIPLKWGPLTLELIRLESDLKPQIACFVGSTKTTLLYLVGSWRHVVGSTESGNISFYGSNAYALFLAIKDEMGPVDLEATLAAAQTSGRGVLTYSDILNRPNAPLHSMPFERMFRSPYQRVEFVARKITEVD